MKIPPMIYIACGVDHMMAISAFKREIYAWGNNNFCQLGINHFTNSKKNENEQIVRYLCLFYIINIYSYIC